MKQNILRPIHTISGVARVNLGREGAKIVAYPEVFQLFNDEIGAHHKVTSFGITG